MMEAQYERIATIGKCKWEGLLSDISELTRIQPTGQPFYIPVHG